MALGSVKALAVRTRLSESHCRPLREMINGGMDELAMRAITAHRAWPLHADDWRSCGWCGSEGAVAFETSNVVEQVVECPPSSEAAKVEKEIELDQRRRQDGACRDGAMKTLVSRLHSTHYKSRCSGSEEASELRRASQQTNNPARARAASRRGVGQRRRALQHAAGIRLKHLNKWKQGVIVNNTSYHQTNMAASCIFCKIIKGT